jgi:hypothetical protein
MSVTLVQAASSGEDIKSASTDQTIILTDHHDPAAPNSSDPPYPYYFSESIDESNFCQKTMQWADQVVNGYKDIEDECFRKDFYIEKKCILAGFDFGTYYKPTNVLMLFKRFDNYTEANTALTNFTANFSGCEGKSNVFVNGATGIDRYTEAKILRELKTQREIKNLGKRNVVKFQLIHKQYADDYPYEGEIGYYIYFETRLE